jgi:hypothetical protein
VIFQEIHNSSATLHGDILIITSQSTARISCTKSQLNGITCKAVTTTTNTVWINSVYEISSQYPSAVVVKLKSVQRKMYFTHVCNLNFARIVYTSSLTSIKFGASALRAMQLRNCDIPTARSNEWHISSTQFFFFERGYYLAITQINDVMKYNILNLSLILN